MTGGAHSGGGDAITTRGGGGKPKEMLKLKSARAGVATANPKARAPIASMVLVFITPVSTGTPGRDSSPGH